MSADTSGRRPGPGFRRRAALALAAALVAGAVACSSDDAAPATTEPVTTAPATATTPTTGGAGSEEGTVFPAADWERVEADDVGMDPGALDELADQAEGARSTCLVVTRNGRLVDQHDWAGKAPDDAREAFSVTKSFTSILTGIAQDEGLVSLTDPASEYIPEWAGTPSADVTVGNLVSNDSGRFWNLNSDYVQLVRSPDKTAYAVGLDQEHEPGTVWAYNNAAIQTLDRVLTEATGESPADFADQRLFQPLGMADTHMSRGSADETLMFMGLRTTCLDLARFGWMMLNQGSWDGEQVVSQEYVEAATGQPSTDLNAAYGYLFWLNRSGRVAGPTIATNAQDTEGTVEGPLVPDAPEDVYWALGLGNQIITMIPSEGIVAVRMGEPPTAEAPFSRAELTNGVLDAVVGP